MEFDKDGFPILDEGSENKKKQNNKDQGLKQQLDDLRNLSPDIASSLDAILPGLGSGIQEVIENGLGNFDMSSLYGAIVAHDEMENEEIEEDDVSEACPCNHCLFNEDCKDSTCVCFKCEHEMNEEYQYCISCQEKNKSKSTDSTAPIFDNELLKLSYSMNLKEGVKKSGKEIDGEIELCGGIEQFIQSEKFKKSYSERFDVFSMIQSNKNMKPEVVDVLENYVLIAFRDTTHEFIDVYAALIKEVEADGEIEYNLFFPAAYNGINYAQTCFVNSNDAVRDGYSINEESLKQQIELTLFFTDNEEGLFRVKDFGVVFISISDNYDGDFIKLGKIRQVQDGERIDLIKQFGGVSTEDRIFDFYLKIPNVLRRDSKKKFKEYLLEDFEQKEINSKLMNKELRCENGKFFIDIPDITDALFNQ